MSTLKVDTIQHSGGTSGMTINSTGRVTTPNKVAFYAVGNNNAYVTTSPIVVPTVRYNFGSGYDNSNDDLLVRLEELVCIGLSYICQLFIPFRQVQIVILECGLQILLVQRLFPLIHIIPFLMLVHIELPICLLVMIYRKVTMLF